MLSCREVTELVSDYLEGDLPRRERLRVQVHILMCRYCRRYLSQMRKVVGILRGLPAEPAPPEVLDKLLPQFREKHDKQP